MFSQREDAMLAVCCLITFLLCLAESDAGEAQKTYGLSEELVASVKQKSGDPKVIDVLIEEIAKEFDPFLLVIKNEAKLGGRFEKLEAALTDIKLIHVDTKSKDVTTTVNYDAQPFWKTEGLQIYQHKITYNLEMNVAAIWDVMENGRDKAYEEISQKKISDLWKVELIVYMPTRFELSNIFKCVVSGALEDMFKVYRVNGPVIETADGEMRKLWTDIQTLALPVLTKKLTSKRAKEGYWIC